MSEFNVTVEEIESVQNHPDADRLEIATLTRLDFQFVVPIGVYKPGDKVVYFPVDSIIPETHLQKMGLSGKLSGKEHNRLKTVRLRGVYSQGLVATLDTFDLPGDLQVGSDLTNVLGVTKYEPAPVLTKGANLLPLPNMVSTYDIESAQRFRDVANRLMDEHVVVTEKMEGSNWGTVFTLQANGEFSVQTIQRNYTIDPIDDYEHTWVKMSKELLEGMSEVVLYLFAQPHLSPVHVVTFRGEILGPGIQGNYYNLKQHQVMLFDIEVNGEPLDFPYFIGVCQRGGLPVVPVLGVNMTLRDWLDGQNVVDASNGRSVVSPEKLREGIVFRPLWEMKDMELGRVILKVRSPQYLTRTDN